MENVVDDYAFLSIGENAINFEQTRKTCFPWHRLIDGQGAFDVRYKNFTTTTSSLNIVYSSFIANDNFSVRINALKFQGNYTFI